jgi:alpha-ketoglutarate-dependent taurine dioxygenase
VSDHHRVGIEYTGISGTAFADPDLAARVLADLGQYGVVVYREANIDDAALVGFSRLLGKVVVALKGGLAEHPEVSPVSLDPARSELSAYRRSTFFWHIDGANDLIPQKATLLAAREVADEGGDTEFANTYAAYDALPEEDKAQLAQVRLVHSMAASQLLVHPDPTPKQRAAWDSVPDPAPGPARTAARSTPAPRARRTPARLRCSTARRSGGCGRAR